MASRSILDLDERLQPLAQSFLENCKAAGLDAILIQTYRSAEEQNADYASGRTRPGPILTNAKPGQSAHNCVGPDGTPAALAFDFSLYDADGKNLDWNAEDQNWQTAIQIGKDLGLISGSTFHGIPDSDHMEYPGWNIPHRTTNA